MVKQGRKGGGDVSGRWESGRKQRKKNDL